MTYNNKLIYEGMILSQILSEKNIEVKILYFSLFLQS